MKKVYSFLMIVFLPIAICVSLFWLYNYFDVYFWEIPFLFISGGKISDPLTDGLIPNVLFLTFILHLVIFFTAIAPIPYFSKTLSILNPSAYGKNALTDYDGIRVLQQRYNYCKNNDDMFATSFYARMVVAHIVTATEKMQGIKVDSRDAINIDRINALKQHGWEERDIRDLSSIWRTTSFIIQGSFDYKKGVSLYGLDAIQYKVDLLVNKYLETYGGKKYETRIMKDSSRAVYKDFHFTKAILLGMIFQYVFLIVIGRIFYFIQIG